MRRIVVLGALSPLGRSVMSALNGIEGIEFARGIENRGRSSSDRFASRDDPDVDVVGFAPDHRPLTAYLDEQRVDCVIQCGLVPDRAGLATMATPAEVIAAMCVGAAIGHKRSSVRSWVVVSSSAIYPIGSHSPLLQSEIQTPTSDEESVASSISEAEDYAIDLATRLPHVNVAILRLQHLIGPDARGPLQALLGRSLIPTPMGFDPAIQLLHMEDAADAIAFAAENELAGVFNVASAGTIRWSEVLDAKGSTRIPVLPIRSRLFEPVLRGLGLPTIPSDLHDLLLYGHAVDTDKIERAGWTPRFDQRACLLSC